MRSTVIIFACLISLSGCKGMDPAKDYLSTHTDVPQPTAEAIMKGRVLRGMTTEQVRAAWGSPDRIRRSSWGMTWTYSRYLGSTLGRRYSFVYFDTNGNVRDWSEE